MQSHTDPACLARVSASLEHADRGLVEPQTWQRDEAEPCLAQQQDRENPCQLARRHSEPEGE